MSQLGRKATGGFWQSFHCPEKETRVVPRLPLLLELNAHVISKANQSPGKDDENCTNTGPGILELININNYIYLNCLLNE